MAYLLLHKLEGMACYSGQLPAPAEGFGLGKAFFFCQKRAFYAVLANFRPCLMFSSNFTGGIGEDLEEGVT